MFTVMGGIMGAHYRTTTALEHVDIPSVQSAVCILQTPLDKARDKPDLVSSTLASRILGSS